MPSPHPGSERRFQACFLVQLSARGVFEGLSWFQTSAGRYPETISIVALRLKEKQTLTRVEEQDTRSRPRSLWNGIVRHAGKVLISNRGRKLQR